MYRSAFGAFVSTELYLESDSRAIPTQDDDTADAVPDSGTTLLAMAREAPRKSWQTASSTLRLWSLILHSLLVAMHLTLVGIWTRGLEHRVTVAVDNQKFASFLITATATAFGTVYSALLVVVTQTLSMRRDLQVDQVLTATHDKAAAWAGIGAAIFHLWHQKAVRSHASIVGVLSAALYLSAILGVHITTSSLFSLGTFNATRTFDVGTRSLPAFNSTPNASVLVDIAAYAEGSLYFLPSIVDSTTSLGLQEATLYDVLDITVPSGNATVNATGFSVTCGSRPDVGELQGDSITGWSSSEGFWIYSTQLGIISNAIPNSSLFNDSIVLYSTIPIVDSSGDNGSWANVIPPMNTSVSSVQLLECSLSLVRQTTVVDSQSRPIQPAAPDFKKTASTWMPYNGPRDSSWGDTADNATTGNLFIDLWGKWYGVLPLSQDFLLDFSTPDELNQFASVADLYLIQKLNLPAANHDDTLNVTLHDVENALSVLAASMFWTCHIPPTHTTIPLGIATIFYFLNGTLTTALSDDLQPVILLPGKAALTEIYVAARLELSIIAISAGFAISVVLMLLSLWLQRGSKDAKDLPIDGTGVLHAIWLYRNHPELETRLEQVEHPTVNNLRAAGMVRTRLVGGQHRGRESFQSAASKGKSGE
ncbi:hypothetical protein C8R44DRAFT_870660 [Mycena epipterygia]|nr:hypothetical protein C8R44DRAFT_870660 [Mycena epipterygia]